MIGIIGATGTVGGARLLAGVERLFPVISGTGPQVARQEAGAWSLAHVGSGVLDLTGRPPRPSSSSRRGSASSRSRSRGCAERE